MFKRFTWILAIYQSFISCQSGKNQHKTESIEVFKESFTVYIRDGDAVRVARLISSNNKEFALYKYRVDFSKPEEAQQTFDKTKHLKKHDTIGLKNQLLKEYNWTPLTAEQVLFVQLQTRQYKEDMQMLDARQDIEVKIGDALEKRNLGEWSAGDLGPGGGNILYEVKNINSALSIVLKVLAENNLSKNVIIGRRILRGKDDWFYEVIYPLTFSGEFNTM